MDCSADCANFKLNIDETKTPTFEEMLEALFIPPDDRVTTYDIICKVIFFPHTIFVKIIQLVKGLKPKKK